MATLFFSTLLLQVNLFVVFHNQPHKLMRYWLHESNSDNLESILKRGLRLEGRKLAYSGGRTVSGCGFFKYYGGWPIFVARYVWSLPRLVDRFYMKRDTIRYEKESFKKRNVLFRIDLDGYNLLPDLPSLYDRGAEITEHGTLVFSEKDEPEKMKKFLVDGEVYIDDLLNNPAYAEAAIRTTRTAAVLKNIPPDRLQLVT